jgi:hypothetical protein
MFHRLALLLLLGLCAAVTATAAPPEGDEIRLYKPYEQWFKSLWNPAFAGACCDLSDCRYVNYTANDGGYVIEINGQSIPVPGYAVINKQDNPTGRGVACYKATDDSNYPYEIMCFVRAADG